MENDPEITVKLKISQINVIGPLLADQPWKVANPLIYTLETQVKEQLDLLNKSAEDQSIPTE